MRVHVNVWVVYIHMYVYVHMRMSVAVSMFMSMSVSVSVSMSMNAYIYVYVQKYIYTSKICVYTLYKDINMYSCAQNFLRAFQRALRMYMQMKRTNTCK